jgi:hypothetical protein
MSKVVCQAEYQYGNLTYIVKILQENKAWDWENEKEITGEFYFVEYTEPTLPSKNRVGEFFTTDQALTWAKSQFGELSWKK